MGKTLGNADDTSHTKERNSAMVNETLPQGASPQRTRQAWSVLIVSTFAFTVCFMVWMMFGVIGIPIKKMLNLNSTQFGLLMSMPVLTGSLVRVPLGIWTDKYGGRIVMAAVMAATVPAIWMMGYATEYWHFLTIAPLTLPAGSPRIARARLWVFMAQAIRARPSTSLLRRSFWWPSAGPWCPRCTPPSCWARWCCSGCSATATLPIWCPATSSSPTSSRRSRTQLKALKDPKVLKYCQYYSIVFGGYVALSLWMVQYYVGEFGLDIRVAALLAACFSLPGGVLRAIGGMLSDKYGAHSVTWWVMWVSWICLFLLSYPQTDFTIATVNGPKTFHIGLNVYVFTGIMFLLGICWAFGKASVFKYISDDYPQNIGTISGIVGLAGGMGGFVLPIMFGALMDLTGIRSSAFMLMYGVVWVSLIWMYFTEVRRAPVMGAQGAAQAGSR